MQLHCAQGNVVLLSIDICHVYLGLDMAGQIYHITIAHLFIDGLPLRNGTCLLEAAIMKKDVRSKASHSLTLLCPNNVFI